MVSKRNFHKVVIGRSELLTFVGSKAINIPAKVDTGAFSSSVHAKDISVDDHNILSFELLGGHPLFGSMAHRVQAEEYTTVDIINSFGHREQRFKVKLKVKLGPKTFHAYFTLSDRSKMTYPILIGRSLLNDRFIVDSAESGVDRAALKEQYGIEFRDDEEAKQ